MKSIKATRPDSRGLLLAFGVLLSLLFLDHPSEFGITFFLQIDRNGR